MHIQTHVSLPFQQNFAAEDSSFKEDSFLSCFLQIHAQSTKRVEDLASRSLQLRESNRQLGNKLQKIHKKAQHLETINQRLREELECRQGGVGAPSSFHLSAISNFSGPFSSFSVAVKSLDKDKDSSGAKKSESVCADPADENFLIRLSKPTLEAVESWSAEAAHLEEVGEELLLQCQRDKSKNASLAEVNAGLEKKIAQQVEEISIELDQSRSLLDSRLSPSGCPKPFPLNFSKEIQQKKEGLQFRSRQYVWRHEPSEMEQESISWIRVQIKVVNENLKVLHAKENALESIRKEGVENVSIDDVAEKLKSVKLDKTLVDWEELEDDEGLEDDSQDLLQSLYFPEKRWNVSTPREYIKKQELLYFEKEKQLGRTLTYLQELLQKKRNENSRTALFWQEVEHKQEQERLERLQAEVRSKAKWKSERSSSIGIARNLMWECLPRVERIRVEHELNQSGRSWRSVPVKEFAFQCQELFVRKYLDQLRSLPSYGVIQQFKAELEEDFTY